MIRRPPQSTPFPTRRSSDLQAPPTTALLLLGQNARRLQCSAALTTPRHKPNQTLRFQSLKDRKSTRLNSSHSQISYAVFCLKKKKRTTGRGEGGEMGRHVIA